jgi:2-polyprenyl-6-methoxyphenol hydroxylase-like FAD-dependent oxidoreductase
MGIHQPDGRLVIAGGGIAGLALALAAGRQGQDVLVLERDPAPSADSPEAAFQTSRVGAPQAHQTHGFLARLTKVLRQRFPDVLDALVDAGARELPLTRDLGDPRPGDEELAILVLRRTTLEWVLRRAALTAPNVEIRSEVGVGGVVVSPGPIPTVRGAQLINGDVVEAGTVVACTGRRGDVPAWMAQHGVEIPEQEHDTRFVYLTRWYHWLEARELVLPARLGGDLGFLKYLTVPCDGDTFSITLAVMAKDGELRSHLSDPETFERTCRMLPGPQEFFAHGPVEALGPVRPMGGLVNRLRTFLDADGQPRVLAFHAVGDAHTCTNPLYGRGCALGFVQATMVADALVEHPDDLVARSIAYEAACAREIEPWFHLSVQMDQFRPGQNGEGSEDGGRAAGTGETPGDVFARIIVEGGSDPVIGRGILRFINLLALPQDLMTDMEFVAAVAPIVSNPEPAPLPTPEGPTREDVLAA